MQSKPLLSTDSLQMRSFLGAGKVYNKFTKDFAKTAWQLNGYVQKNKDFYWLNRTTEALDIFNAFKYEMNSYSGPLANTQIIYDRHRCICIYIESCASSTVSRHKLVRVSYDWLLEQNAQSCRTKSFWKQNEIVSSRGRRETFPSLGSIIKGTSFNL